MREFESSARPGVPSARSSRRLRPVDTVVLSELTGSSGFVPAPQAPLAPGLRLMLALGALAIAALAGYVVGRRRPLDPDLSERSDDIVMTADEIRETSDVRRVDEAADTTSDRERVVEVSERVVEAAERSERVADRTSEDDASVATPRDPLAGRRIVAFVDDDTVDDFAAYPVDDGSAAAMPSRAWLAAGSPATVRLALPPLVDRSETWAIASIAFLASSLTLALGDAPPLAPMVLTGAAGFACLVRLAAMLWQLEFGPKDPT